MIRRIVSYFNNMWMWLTSYLLRRVLYSYVNHIWSKNFQENVKPQICLLNQLLYYIHLESAKVFRIILQLIFDRNIFYHQQTDKNMNITLGNPSVPSCYKTVMCTSLLFPCIFPVPKALFIHHHCISVSEVVLVLNVIVLPAPSES